MVVGFGARTLFSIVTCTLAPIAIVSLASNAGSMIRSIDNFKVIALGIAIVVCTMPTRLTSILIYRALKGRLFKFFKVNFFL